MKILLSILTVLAFSVSLFSQTKSPKPFGEAVVITTDSIKKLPVSDILIGKWVLISSKIKKGHDEDMESWNMQTVEFKNDRTLIITPGPYERKTYWSYNESEKSMAIYTAVQGSKVVTRVKFPVLKMTKDVLTTTEWINTKAEDKHFQKLTFLKVE